MTARAWPRWAAPAALVAAAPLLAMGWVLPILSITMEPSVFNQMHQASGARGRASEREGHVEVVTTDGDVVVSTENTHPVSP